MNTQDTATNPNQVILDTPIKRGETEVADVTLRKPQSGELRGISLADLANFQVDALVKVLPRISSPTLTEHEVRALDPADLLQMGSVIAGFLLPKALQANTDYRSA